METRDVIVVGSGGAGLTTAVVAAREGLDVLVAEKGDCFGGTTALSGGGIWVPGSSASVRAGFRDSRETARGYVRQVVGPGLDLALLDTFLDAAPQMVDYLEARTAVKFELQPGFPDWSPDLPGAADDGRLLSPVEYDGRELGEYFLRLKTPLSEFNAPGGFMVGINDMPHIANATRSFASFRHMARLLARFAMDRLRYPRGTRLTMGNALAARLLRSALDAGVTLWNRSPVVELVRDGGHVVGVILARDGQRTEVRARRGVMLASGGFSANPEMRARFIPFAEHHVSLVPDTNTGDGINLALEAGGVMDKDNVSNGAWTVMSLAREADGRVIKFPHIFLDRSKPGCIAVNREGRRFTDEATLDMVKDMHATGSVPAHLVCDHRFIKKYGLGMVKPGGLGLKKWIANGYIITAPTLRELAALIDCDPANLEDSAARMTRYAAEGQDPDFGKGGNASDRAMGDPNHAPNPCLGPVDTPPFYGYPLRPGITFTYLGVTVNEHAQVIMQNDQPISNIYAAGEVMAGNILGQGYMAGFGMTIGTVFGRIAGREAVQHAID